MKGADFQGGEGMFDQRLSQEKDNATVTITDPSKSMVEYNHYSTTGPENTTEEGR